MNLTETKEYTGEAQYEIARRLVRAGFLYLDMKDFVETYNGALFHYALTPEPAAQKWWQMSRAVIALGHVCFGERWKAYLREETKELSE